MIEYITAMDLRLFGEGAGTGAGGEGAAAGEAQAAPADTRAGKKAGEFDNVVFGRKPGAQGEAETGTADAGQKATTAEITSSTQEDKAAQWRRMIEGDFKDLYTQDTQRIINQRFKETKALQQKVDSYQPILDVLAKRYGESDPARLAAKIDSDSAYWSQAADEAGMSVEQFKEMQRLKAQNELLVKEKERRRGEDQANAQIQAWVKEAEAVKAKYAGFDLNTEARDPKFLGLLKAGTPMELAYRVMHMDAMMSDAIQTVAAATEQKVVANVKAKGSRPAESGAAAQGGFTYRDDVSKLTKAERAEIARRVQRGERITF